MPAIAFAIMIISMTQLTNDPYQNGYADWSPDGKYIVYTTDMNTADALDGDLWHIPANGGSATRLTTHGAHHGVFSPDGDYIALDADEGSVIQIIPSTGGVPIRIVPKSIPVRHSGNPCWSPDGTQIAFRSVEELWITDLPTGKYTKVFHKLGLKPMPIHWSRTQDSIVTALLDTDSRLAELWKIPIDGGEPEQLTFQDTYISQATVSPDESLIVFASPAGGNNDLWIMPYDGGTPVRLTKNAGLDVEPCFSPDGDKIVFTSTRSGRVELWVMVLDLDEVWDELNH